RIHESRRARHTMASAKMRKPVHAIGVFHDQNGSILASVAAWETIMIASPTQIAGAFNTTDTKDTKVTLSCVFSFCPQNPFCPRLRVFFEFRFWNLCVLGV